MNAEIIDGKKIAKQILTEVSTKVALLKNRDLNTLGLAVILVGDDIASSIYVANKCKMCEELGFYFKKILLPTDIPEEELLKIIHDLNQDLAIDGILVQLPLPKKINCLRILQAIDFQKDVDGLHPINLGKILYKKYSFIPCVVKSIIYILKRFKFELANKQIVIIGASFLVGLPTLIALVSQDATVMICNVKTKNLAKKVKEADIVISATGQPHLIKGSWIKKGACVIDVGINRLRDGCIVGDVDFAQAKLQASYITPVPGGIGPITIAMLAKNLLKANRYRNQHLI